MPWSMEDIVVPVNSLCFTVINRPGVAVAVLQTALLLINSHGHDLPPESLKRLPSNIDIVRAREIKI